MSDSDWEVQVDALPDTAKNDDSTVLAHRVSGAVEVWLYEVSGGGHTDPSMSERYSRLFKRVVGDQNGDIESAEVIWDFFSRSQ